MSSEPGAGHFDKYLASRAYEEKVSQRTRPDYLRSIKAVSALIKDGARLGAFPIAAVSPRIADQIYDQMVNCDGPPRLRQAEKKVRLCSKAWRVVQRLHPEFFDQRFPDPWNGVALKRRRKTIKQAVGRAEVYEFAWGCIALGHPAPAAAAVICFEWLQRPENVLAGFLKWEDYRNPKFPDALRILHNKTGAVVWHPLEETTDVKTTVFYAEAEAVLQNLPRYGSSVVMRLNREGNATLFKPTQMQRLVQRLRTRLGLSSSFTLDACRHGGLTELEEAALTDGQGRALSGHRTQASYVGYAKRSLTRAISATRKRYEYKRGTAADKFLNGFRNGLNSSDQ